jgi:hypothetical protein
MLNFDSRLSDGRLAEWLMRVIPSLRECKPLTLECLEDKVPEDPGVLPRVIYGLVRLTDAIFAEGSMNFFDYAAVALTLSRVSDSVAEVLGELLAKYFDSGNIPASELAYPVSFMLVFQHRRTPSDLIERWSLIRYSPDPVAACRALQLLRRELEADKIDEWNLKPRLIVASYGGNMNLYVIE